MVRSLKKKHKVKFDLLTYINVLLIVEKCIRGRICHVIHQHVQANNKYMKDYYKNQKTPYLKYWDENNCMEVQSFRGFL